MKKVLTYHKNHKGITLVLMAFFLVLLLFFLGMAVDIAYMYVVKNQLQVAADSGALAGEEKIDCNDLDSTCTGIALLDTNTSNYIRIKARQEAWKFACKNRAAGQSVYLATNTSLDCDTPPAAATLNGANSADGDIVVGHWSSSLTCPSGCTTGGSVCESAGSGSFCPANGGTGLTINALKARPRRTGESEAYGMPQVGVFVGQVFRYLGGSGWPVMSAASSAIAGRPPEADAYFDVCWQVNPDLTTEGACKGDDGGFCSVSYPCTVANGRLSSVRNLCTQSSVPNTQSMGWTSLTTPPCSENNISDTLLCAAPPRENVCLPTPKQICVQNGGTSSPKEIGSLMYDPLYDSGNKTCADGMCDASSDTVTGWTVIVPITNTCPAGTGGSSNASPKDVYGYARLHLTTVCWSGSGQGCVGHNPPSPSSCTNFCGNNYIVVDSIACVDCANSDTLLGPKTVLVK